MKKRLIFFGIKTFPSQGGTDRVAENLIAQLQESFDITLYCFKDRAARTHVPGIKVIEMPRMGTGSVGSFVYFLFSTLHILLTQRADLIHAHKTDCAFFIPFLRLRFPVVATSHEAPYKRDKWNAFEKFYFRLAERLFIHSSTLCTCISEPLTKYYIERYGRKVIFIPNGINPITEASFDFDGVHRFLSNGASLDRPYVLFSARRIMKTKGCHTMLEALASIRYTGQVLIAGELTHNLDYVEQLKRAGQSLDVHFLGFVHPLPVLLALVSQADFFIFPSETEGMSIMLLEVASAGRPIIASDIPENRQVFTENEVLFFRVGNAQDLANKIHMALNERNTIEALAVTCREKVYTDYVWNKIALRYADVYRTVIG